MESNDQALVTTEAPGSSALAPMRWTPAQIDLMKRTIAKDCTDDELALFLHVVKRTGLDPLARQIYAIKRRSKGKNDEWVETMTIQTGIDGYRLQAERTGKFKGMGNPQWCDENAVWHDVWISDKPPTAARVKVMRDGADEPIEGIALYREYVQTKDGKAVSRWAAAPAGMLAKCAEALALRRAFPAELSGLYIAEEMGRADSPQDESNLRQPQRLSEKTPASESKPAGGSTKPKENPWVGPLDDVKKSGAYWIVSAEQGAVTWVCSNEQQKETACEIMSDGKTARIEWTETKNGNARITGITGVIDA